MQLLVQYAQELLNKGDNEVAVNVLAKAAEVNEIFYDYLTNNIFNSDLWHNILLKDHSRITNDDSVQLWSVIMILLHILWNSHCNLIPTIMSIR